MSFRMFAAVLFFGLLIAGVTANAGFCAQLVQSNGPANLNNGANSVNLGSGAWTTSATGTFSDGQFQTDGGYIIPVGGVYHFDAVMQVQVVSISPPNQEVDIRVVKCSGGCNALCSGGTDVGETLIQSGALYLSEGFTAALPPEYSLSVSYTGLFNTGDLVALCIDNQASSSAVKLNCPSNTCLFSGFAAN